MNPCPCGHLGDLRRPCRCPEGAIERYRARTSGPLLDRIDLHVEVPVPSAAELRAEPGAGEPGVTVATRVAAARRRQQDRLPSRPLPTNAAIDEVDLRRWYALDSAAQRLADAAFERLGLSAHALSRLLKVARTIADLISQEGLATTHLAEALQYRCLDRVVPVGGSQPAR